VLDECRDLCVVDQLVAEETNLRSVRVESADDRREDRVGDRGEVADGQMSELAAPGAPRELDRALSLNDGEAGLLQQCLSSRREAHATCGSIEERDTEFILEETDLLAQGRLTDLEPLCRATEVKLLSNHDEVAQNPDTCIHSSRLSITAQSILDSLEFMPIASCHTDDCGGVMVEDQITSDTSAQHMLEGSVPSRGLSYLNRRQILAGGAAALAAATLAATRPASANTQQPVQPRADFHADGRFTGKVILITGATSGIGRTTAEAFAREGAKVLFCGRREQLGADVEAGIRGFGGEATYRRADVRLEEDVRALVDACVGTYGRIDVAFNNAGIETPRPKPLAEQSFDDWRDVMETNATGVFLSMKYEIPQMLRQSGGTIINTGSVSSHVGYATIAPYNASKHAIWSLTRVASLEYAPLNIRVNMVSPGAAATPMLDRALVGFGTTPEQIAQTIPIRRISTTEEIARLVLFLASEEASTLSGMDIDATGGMLSS
jgi:NAD(P)-dependent dehydrogenase (short-subunit alcohol dehydrogenase family)